MPPEAGASDRLASDLLTSDSLTLPIGEYHARLEQPAGPTPLALPVPVSAPPVPDWAQWQNVQDLPTKHGLNELHRQIARDDQHKWDLTISPGPQTSLAPAGSSTSPPPVSTHVTDEQVEAVALRGFLQGVETEEDWLIYRSELGQHLAPFAVEEVGQRLRELWRLNRQAQAGV